MDSSSSSDFSRMVVKLLSDSIASRTFLISKRVFWIVGLGDPMKACSQPVLAKSCFDKLEDLLDTVDGAATGSQAFF